MTTPDALDRAFLKGSGASSVATQPNKGKTKAVDPLEAAFMRGLEQTPMAEVANTSMEAPYTPTSMAGALARGFGGGLAQGARDILTTAGKAVVGVPEAVVGLVDVIDAPMQAIFSKLSTGRVQLGQVGKMLEDVGVDFKTTQDFLSTLYSDEQKRALKNVGDKKSVGGKLVSLGANPTVPIHSILQSIPTMMLSASASAPMAAAGMKSWLAGALSEGIVQAGSSQEQTRQQSDTGTTTPKQTALAVASGLVDAAISAASGKISKGIGLEDVESIGASGSSTGGNLGFWRKLVGGMFMEGPVEEGLQSAQEKIAQNLALGRPWDEDVKGTFAEGSVSGAVMGAGANALPSKGKSNAAPLDADAWIKENADMLPEIAAKEKLGRKYWETLGLPRVDEVVRDEFLQKVKDTVGGVAPAPVEEAAPTVQEQDTPEPEAVVEDEVKPAKAPVPDAKAAVDEVQAELDAQTAEEDADEAAYALFGKREAKTPVPDATATPVASEAPVPTDTAAEAVKPVDATVAAEAEAVAERKKGKRVPKAPKPVNKGKGVVEPVVEVEKAKTEDAQEKEYMSEVVGDMPGIDAKRISLKWTDGTGSVNFVDVYHDGKYAGRAVVKRGEKTGFQDAANRSVASVQAMIESTAMGVREDVAEKRPVSSEVIDAIGEVPEGYVREGERHVFKSPPPVADVAAKEPDVNGSGVIDEDVKSIDLKMNDGNTISFKKTSRVVNHSKGRVIQEIEGTTKDGKFVGVRFLVNKDNKTLTIVGLASEAKGSGYGTQLLNSIKEEARKNGIEKIVADDTRKTNSLKYWEKQGFKPDGGINAALDMNSSPISPPAPLKAKGRAKPVVSTDKESLTVQPPAPVKVETEPVLDSKGRTPEQLARMTANARAFKEASAKEGALPKPKPNPALASSVAKAKSEGNDIELVDTVSDLPADIRSQLRSDTENIEGFYVNGKKYIIGENVTADRAEAVVREEMAHRKLDTAQGEELIDGFKKRMTEKDRKALIKEGYTKTRGESDADYEARLANEFIAKQARKNTTAWTEFVDSVKSFLESVGIRDLTSEEAARVILRKLRGGAATGKGVRYSLTPAAELDEAKYESAKGIFGTKLERLGEAGFRKWVAEKLPDSAMPYAERFLSERSAMATVPKGRNTSLARRVSEPERAALNLDTETRGGQGTWEESVAKAVSTVKTNESAGDELISELVDNPRPLTQDEIALLLRAKTQRWNARDAAMKTKDRAKIDTAQKRLLEAYFVSDLGPDKSISMVGAALNALKMMNNEKYELINMTQEMYAITGDISKPGSQAYKDLEAIAQQYKERTEVLERENTRLQEESATMSQSLADALAQSAYNQGKPKSKGKSKASKIASVADLISKKSRDYGTSLIEQARKEQAALNMRASAGVDPARLLMLSKFAAGHIMLGVSDVAIKVSEFYGAKVTAAEMAQIMSEAKKIATDATSRIAKEAESETLASRVIPKGKGAKTATQLSEVSLKDMFREQAENGVKTFKEALPLVGKLVRASGINATDAQIRDVYDSYIKEPGVLSTDEIKKIIAGYRQEAQLLSKINDAERGVRPHKIGAPRFPSSQEARELEKELDDLMKNVTFSGDKKPTDIASPLDAKKTWMQNEIDDMEKAIALHEKRFQGEKGITDQGDIEYQRLKEQLEDVRKRYAEAFPKKPLTQEEQLAILIKQAEKILAKWNQRVIDAKSGKFKSRKRVERPYSERLAELQYQRENAKAEVARLYELQNPGKRAREAQMKRDLAAIKEMERRMAAGDYTTPTTTTMDLSGDAPAMAAHVAREQTKKTYEQHKARAAWNKLPKWRRRAIFLKNILMSDKAFKYSADDSNPGRQGWMFALTHTEKWFKTAKRGLSAASSKNSAQIIQEIKENELYKSGVLKAAGLNINVKDATGQYGSEDDANLEFVNKIPVYGEVTKVSGRMFGATANLQRLEFLTTILEGSKFGRAILADPYHRTDAQNEFLKHVGWGVNIFTGFVGGNLIKPGFMLGAPNWVFSVLLNFGQVPVANALIDGDWKAAAALEKQYGRFYLATLSLIAAMSLLPSGPKDDEGKRKRHRVVLDPRSNRVGIGYIPYTPIPVNVFGPLAPWIHFIGMNVTGQKISGGEIINLRNSFLWTHTEEQKAKGVPWKGEQWQEDLRFLRSKFRPLVTTAMGLRDGLNFFGQETSRLRLLVEAYQPLTPLNFIENLVRVPPEQAAAETLMEFFGLDSKPDFNTPQYKKYEAKMRVVDEMFKLKFKGENGKSFGDRAEDIYIANAMKTIHSATDTDSSPGSQESAKMLIDDPDLGLDACLLLLYYQAVNESLSRGSTKLPEEKTKDGNLTAYGKRVQKLRIISAQ